MEGRDRVAQRTSRGGRERGCTEGESLAMIERDGNAKRGVQNLIVMGREKSKG